MKSLRSMLKTSIVIALLLAALIACQLPMRQRNLTIMSVDATIQRVDAPKGTYGSPFWWDSKFVVFYEEDWGENGTQYSGRIWQIKNDGSELEVLSLPNLDRCERNGFDAGSVLPNNLLAYIVTCREPNNFIPQLYMMSYDPDTGQTKPLLDYPLPSSQIGTSGYSWHPDMTHGITSDGNGSTLEEQLYWFRPEGYEFIDLGFPQAWGPKFRPDGEQITFFAAPEQGREGIDRLDSVYNLYLMNPDESNVRPLVNGLRHPTGLAWSPDGRWIAFSAELAKNSRQEGIWLTDAETGASKLLIRGSYGRPSWSPDGEQMVVVEFSDDPLNDPTNHLEIVDVHWP